MEYNTDYFINKFEAIPENLWCVGILNEGDKFCALGFCGVKADGSGFPDGTEESYALDNLFSVIQSSPPEVNDGAEIGYPQPTPKQRILAALYDIKAGEAVKEVQELVNQNQSIEQKAEVTTETEIVSQ